MRLSKAEELVAIGRGVISGGMFRPIDQTGVGYERAPGVYRYAGRVSGPAGPTVMQACGRVRQ